LDLTKIVKDLKLEKERISRAIATLVDWEKAQQDAARTAKWAVAMKPPYRPPRGVRSWALAHPKTLFYQPASAPGTTGSPLSPTLPPPPAP
jgi:hypothetical protein